MKHRAREVRAPVGSGGKNAEKIEKENRRTFTVSDFLCFVPGGRVAATRVINYFVQILLNDLSISSYHAERLIQGLLIWPRSTIGPRFGSRGGTFVA
jgi:hypothetical protein